MAFVKDIIINDTVGYKIWMHQCAVVAGGASLKYLLLYTVYNLGLGPQKGNKINLRICEMIN